MFVDLSPMFRNWMMSCGNLEACWQACDRPDWMIALLRLSNRNDSSAWRMITALAVRRAAIKHIPDEMISNYMYGYFGAAKFLTLCYTIIREKEARLHDEARGGIQKASDDVDKVSDLALDPVGMKDAVTAALAEARNSSAQGLAMAEDHATVKNGLYALEPFVREEATEADACQAWIEYVMQTTDHNEKQRHENDLVNYIRQIVPKLLEKPCQSVVGY
jgi:hypothetical protein